MLSYSSHGLHDICFGPVIEVQATLSVELYPEFYT